MAAIQWERIEHRAPQRDAVPPVGPMRLVTAPPSRRRPSAAVYRRRRLIALLLVATVLMTVSSIGIRWATASASAGATATSSPVVLVARPGDSYWTLARKLHAGGDLRSVVDELVAANGGGDLHAGDRIVLAH